jgi:hypothetical protein
VNARGRLLCLLAALALAACLADPAGASGEARPMPFNARRNRAAKYVGARCALFAMVMKQAGYDFDATARSAATNLTRGGDPLRNPRFKFLAGVFQIHPREFLKRRLISQETYQAVMAVFEQ